MPSDRVNRHKARQQKLTTLRHHRDEIETYRIPANSSSAGDEPSLSNNDVLSSFIARQGQDIAEAVQPVAVSSEEVFSLLEEIQREWSNQHLDTMLRSCRNSVIGSVVGPFGLGGIVAKYDVDGGNVTTIHNAKQDVYARAEDQYDRRQYVNGKYKQARERYIDEHIIENAGMVVDEYSGHEIDYSAAEVDHIKSLKSYHQEGGFMQSKQKKTAFAADSGNFAVTSGKANSSLGSKKKGDWQKEQATDDSGRTNKEAFEHDNRRVNAAVTRGLKTAEQHAPSTKDKVEYYAKRIGATGSVEFAKMGAQQSIGLLLTEFFSAVFDEVQDAYKSGFRGSLADASFFDTLRARLKRIVKRVAARWKDAAKAFFAGGLSGFLSNMVTTLINMLVTTGKRVVRVIREGLASILKAIKTAIFPPEGLTREEAADAALKLLATGLVTSLGILAEEAVEKSIAAFCQGTPLLPFAPTIAAVFVGAMTGIVSAIVVYGLEKLDIFGVNSKRKHAALIRELDNLIQQSDATINATYDAEMGRLDGYVTSLKGA